jgi:hypothetical protein
MGIISVDNIPIQFKFFGSDDGFAGHFTLWHTPALGRANHVNEYGDGSETN